MIFLAMLDAIRRLKERDEFLTFVYWTGNIVHELAKALAKKAEEGVKVFVILDSCGTAKMPNELLELMENKRVQIERLRPFPQWEIWKIDNRTHRKVLICDGGNSFYRRSGHRK